MHSSASRDRRSTLRTSDLTSVRFASEGLVFIFIAAAVAAGTFALALNRRSWALWLLAFLLTIIALWVAYFFRDPERTGPRGENVVIAPADGNVVLIQEVDEPAFMGGRAKRVSIFMNVFNVHVNRYPVAGKVGYVKYNPGKFLNAAAEKSSLENEQMSVGIESSYGRVMMRQIAGLIARRIVTYSKVGETVNQGDRRHRLHAPSKTPPDDGDVRENFRGSEALVNLVEGVAEQQISEQFGGISGRLEVRDQARLRRLFHSKMRFVGVHRCRL